MLPGLRTSPLSSRPALAAIELASSTSVPHARATRASAQRSITAGGPAGRWAAAAGRLSRVISRPTSRRPTSGGTLLRAAGLTPVSRSTPLRVQPSSALLARAPAQCESRAYPFVKRGPGRQDWIHLVHYLGGEPC